MTNYNIDICDTGNMMYKFCDKYNMGDLEDYQTIFSIFFDKFYDAKNDKLNHISGNYCELKDLVVGDYIRVQYVCYSLKYADCYRDVEGHIIYIDDRKKNGLIYFDIDGVRNISSIEKEYCSYYGDTPGYCCYISK